MESFKLYLLEFLVAIASFIYIYGLSAACYYTINKKFDGQNKLNLIPGFITQSINLIGGVLATNFGAFIGITIDSANKNPEKQKAFIDYQLLSRTVSEVSDKYLHQAIASCVYIVGLTICLVIWGLRKFSEDDTIVVPSFPQMSKTLLGAAVGALIVLLS